jgi:hypothetical protein
MLPADTLTEAKRRLLLTSLMSQLGYGDHAKKSAHCPFHKDSSASFSVFTCNDGLERWNCFAGCGQGDAIDFLAKARNLSISEALVAFKTLAGVPNSLPALRPQPPLVKSPSPLDWPACVAAFTSEHQSRFAEWRGLSPELVAWLQTLGLIGYWRGLLAFPVHDASGAVVRAHVRTVKREAEGTEKIIWFFTPKGPVAPLIIGDYRTASMFWVFESQFDMLAVLDRVGWHLEPPPNLAAIVTRGASNVRLLADLCGKDVTVYAFAQNDVAGKNWLSGVARQGCCRCLHVVTPEPFKDANDWTRAGATSEDVQRAIADARTVLPPACSKRLEQLEVTARVRATPENEDDRPIVAFPVDAFPPALSRIVNAVARAERVPLALPAVCALGVASAALGAGLRVLSAANRFTRGNLFLLADAESGSGKSESCRHIIAPLLEYQATLLDAWREKAYPKNQAEIACLEAQRKALEKRIAKAMRPDNPNTAELEHLRAQLEFPIARTKLLREQAAPCIMADDVTIEALALRLRDNREVLFCFSSDARKPVQNLLGRYNPGESTDESLFLKAYSGEFSRVDRTKAEPIVLRTPCLTLCWFIQPDLFATILNEESLAASGFLPRLLICHTRAAPRRIESEAPGISDSVCASWAQLVNALLGTFHVAVKPHSIEPTSEAKRLLDEFYNSTVDRRQSDLADLGSYAARYGEQAWRVSVVLHAALHGANAGNCRLELETAQNAIRVIEWFTTQQLDIFAKSRRQAAEKLETEVLELLASNWERRRTDFVTARDVHRARIVTTAEAARALLERMEQDGLLISEGVQPRHGGKVTRVYRAVGSRNSLPR